MIPDRFALRLVPIPDTGCHLWEGRTDRKGYAEVKFQGKKMRLNRVLYFIRNGEWPAPGLEMLHSCDTPSCCEETHLSVGTRAQNAQQRQERGRTRGARTYKRAA